ncbi:MAG: DUF4349 domain-containing protein [Phycisphaerales bacterium]
MTHSNPTDNQLATALESLSTPRTAQPPIWQSALTHAKHEGTAPHSPAASDQTTSKSPTTRGRHPWALFNKPMGTRLAPIIATILLMVIGTAIILPSLGKARSSTRLYSSEASVNSALPASVSEREKSIESVVISSQIASQVRDTYSRKAPTSASAASDSPDRLVIRKISLDLAADDVRAAFQKAQLLINEGTGEYIEQSSMQGTDSTDPARQSASLTLRVASNRVSAVLPRLRELGNVVRETASGDDVTDQAIDLDARITNERRVEAELLSLLEARGKDSLADILALRSNINQVRETVERLVAQRDRLGKQAALATILINITAKKSGGEVTPVTPTLSDRFTKSMQRAWEDSLASLIDAAAFLIRTAIAGLPFWVLLLLVVIGIRRLWRWSSQRAADEPAPSLS